MLHQKLPDILNHNFRYNSQPSQQKTFSEQPPNPQTKNRLHSTSKPQQTISTQPPKQRARRNKDSTGKSNLLLDRWRGTSLPAYPNFERERNLNFERERTSNFKQALNFEREKFSNRNEA